MSNQLKIFITGATGYIGGSVLSRLLKHPDAASFQITVLVRSADKGDKLKTLGVGVVVGSYTDDDLSFLKDAAAQADVVIAIADADRLPAAQAILDGMKVKYENSGKAPILIHTSGTAIIMDDARGLTAEHTVYSDLDVEKLNALPATALHRNVDLPIIAADKAGFIKAYIITPGTIFGYPSGPVVELGVQNKHSIQLPSAIKPAIARKQGGYIGKGLNKWPAVSLDDTADLYLVLFDVVRKNPDATGHGPEGYYFAEVFEYSGIEAAATISEALFELGIGSSSEPSAFSQEELDKYYGPIWPFLATNCYARADRSRALGWKPTSTKAEFLANIKAEVKEYASELKSLHVL
ncbi:hypothetical protein GALMADRAFT_134061 [Galerina marginata CBS 339.88]|uniref:NmrA-like domain-containing protein n=1 Tax=Galerina marginata (strain CBS 339.88) TaxID=685588 RepID=A0A067TGZ4_GALM3|nr:hypothetical protein GALMADRAFT_134061 [Galerina marginata CBS 339.88]